MMNDLAYYTCFLSLIYFGVLLSMQFFIRKKGEGIAEYFLAGRSVGLGAAVATLGATEIGLITIAYSAQKGFNTGFSAFHIGLAAFVGCAIVGLTGFIVGPLRRTGVVTIPEFYEQRFGRDVRIFGGTIMALAGILNMGLFLKIASLFLTQLMPEVLATVRVFDLMLLLIGVVLIYTCFGGMRVVIATDIIQFILIVAALGVAIFYLLGHIPLSLAIDTVQSKMGDGGFDPRINEAYGLDYVLWMIVTAGIVSAAVWPTALSRALCIKDEPTVRKAYLISSLIFMGRMIVPAFLGILAFTYFAQEGNTLLLSSFGDGEALVALAVLFKTLLPPVLLALIIVAMFASFMSTQDGYLFCWASILSRDVVAAGANRLDDIGFQKLWTRLFIVAIALFEIYWGFFYTGKDDLWDYLAVTGAIYFCSGIVVLTAGLYWQKASRVGAILALLFGFSAVLSLAPIKTALAIDWSGAMIGFTSIGLSMLGMIIGSLVWPNSHLKAS